jgi:uncharacterized protein (DUF302 family)
MLHLNTSRGFEEIGPALAAATQHHGGSVLAVTHLGQLIKSDQSYDALVYTVCRPDLYAALLASDVRFAAFLPCRITAIKQPSGVILEALEPTEFCRLLGRSDLESAAAPLETFLRSVMEEASKGEKSSHLPAAAAHGSSPGAVETQMNARGAVPQRIDCHGTKVEDLAGTGQQDSPGG